MADEVLDPSRVSAAMELVEAEEGPRRRLTGPVGWAVSAVAVAMSLVFLYWAWGTVTTQILRLSFLGFTLVLSFLLYPARRKRGLQRVGWADWLLVGLSLLAVGYPLWDFEEFIYRAALPTTWDQVFGGLTILLVLEATRRTTGWVLPTVALAFLGYAWLGAWLPAPWTHQGYGLDRLVGHMYMTLEGIFGVPLDVAATFIILFTIYGAFLEHSRAGEFFVNFSLAATGGKPTAAGRTVTLASFLLGGPSGSGVATTVTLGSVAWPLLSRAGYDKASAGGLLSAGGIGAIISPPVLGAAAFLIAEFLKVSYLDVIAMAAIPTLLYYWSVFVMVELDAKKFGAQPVAVAGESVWSLTRKYGFHFLSLVAIIVFMLLGYTAILAVFYATVLAAALSFFRRETALTPRRLGRALEGGSVGVLSVAATCATAGIIVGVVTLTGLGLKFSIIILALAGGALFLTVLYTALAVWILGLAVPVTASYIIAAVITAPAMIRLGVPEYAAHMFIFYYAVLSEVSPPTALSPFAAAAITGGNPYRTTLMAWKYTLPTFLVPFMFTLHPDGVGLLLKGSWGNILWTTTTAMVGLAALAAGLTGWLLRKTSLLEQALLVAAGLVLVYPGWLQDLVGFGLCGLAVLLQALRGRSPQAGRVGVILLAAALLAPALLSAESVKSPYPVEVVAEGLREPRGLLILPDGSLLVAEQTGDALARIAPDGTVTRIEAGLSWPHDVARDAAGALYVADTRRGRIALVSPDGAVSTYVGGLTAPVDLDFDPAGRLVICEFTRGPLRVVEGPGKAEPFGPILAGAHGLLFEPGGGILVVENLAERISRVTRDGEHRPLWEGIRGVGLARGPSGDVYVAEPGAGRVWRLKPGGVQVVVAEGLAGPRDPAFDAIGRLYVAETRAGRIVRFVGAF